MDPDALIQNFAPTLEKLADGNPVQLLGRLVGLGQAEMNAGIPKWAWLLGGAVIGGAAMLVWGGPVRRVLRLDRV